MEIRHRDDSTRLCITRTYPVTPDKVWRAWTEPQILKQWFGPSSPSTFFVAEIDLRIGGRYRLAFSAPDGEVHDVSGAYQEVELNKRLVFTFAWKSTPERVSRVAITLVPTVEGTEFNFVHDRFFDEKARDSHAGGWPLFFENLGQFLEA